MCLNMCRENAVIMIQFRYVLIDFYTLARSRDTHKSSDECEVLPGLIAYYFNMLPPCFLGYFGWTITKTRPCNIREIFKLL